ncbi:MAG: 16S rRNA (cytosine(967)-C(5))-methyltransferase RsmB [Endozoicomonadaceae bacterium]|nr:16S rRNA (cytosine(967)-C(5))-methyltransferase RsmB [Endozoicomonadaceae bacterium]
MNTSSQNTFLKSPSNVRMQAALTIAALLKGRSLATMLPQAESRLHEDEHPLLRELCYGTARHFFSLSLVRDRLLNKPLKAGEKNVQALLLIGLYQLLHTRISEHAILSETVNATHKLKIIWAKGLINAVLRSAQRKRDEISDWAGSRDEARYEHPQWLLNRLKAAWPNQWQALAEAGNLQGPMTLRVNTRQASRDDYLKQLLEGGIVAHACRFAEQGVQLEEATSVTALPGFYDGSVSVQDEAAQLSAVLLDAQPGERILDACAAPGGKSCHILEQTNDLTLWSLDVDSDRTTRIHDNLSRLNLTAHVITGDATQPATWWDNTPFDRILLDAPCSATGVIRRNPDIKLLRRNEDITQLAILQQQIIDQMWSLLKPGGTLLYATCSVMPEENSEQIKAFVERCNDAILEPLSPEYGIDTGYGILLLPQKKSHDGFFYCRLRKKTVIMQD